MSAPELGYDESAEAGSSDTVAGFLSATAMFVALIGVAWHPLRLIPAAMAVALIAAAMGSGRRLLGLVAVAVATACFFVGMAIAVIVQKPLW